MRLTYYNNNQNRLPFVLAQRAEFAGTEIKINLTRGNRPLEIMKKEIEIKTTPKELAELLFDLDNVEVALVFSEWKKLFDKNYEEMSARGETVWIFDLNHFMLYVAKELDEDGIDFFRSAYSSIVYQYCNDIAKKHLTKLQ